MKGKAWYIRNRKFVAIGLLAALLVSGCGGKTGTEANLEDGGDALESSEAGSRTEQDAGTDPGSSTGQEGSTGQESSLGPGSSTGQEGSLGPGSGSAPVTEPSTEPPAGTSTGSNGGKKTSTMEKLLRTSLLPVGTTMYIWGGGWNEEDTGSGIESVTIGLSPRWAEFAAGQTAAYDHNATRYQIHDGLDCSGYIGWLVYNTFHEKSGEEGYVGKSYAMAETFASYGWGDYLPAGTAPYDWKAGDICSMKGHVWLCLGACGDGSVLLIHSSPPGVRICGTRRKDGSDSQAIALAEKCMSTYYPDWYRRYPDCAVNDSYLESASRMRWNSSTLTDAETYQNMSAEEIAAFLFP